ncbi:P-loop containing nucleoside triphosphate hydrolase protein [Xylariaceae sp. FL0662B]|nr:P-loop containing nucleoside triphosphate hydrolase protein [Xylariaceae sp. FL0662B]
MAAGRSQEFHIPIAKSFSFAIPEVWKPTKPSLLRWLDDVPGSVRREEPLEPAHFQVPKHDLDMGDVDGGHGIDDHRNKRAKLGSSLGQHPGLATRRQRLTKSSQGLVRRFSGACRRIVTPSRYQDDLDGSTIRGSGSLPGTPTTIVDRPKMRFVFVGDAGCGKSSLLLRYYRDTFTLAYTKTQYELFSKTAVVDGQEVDLELWDTSGNVDLHQLQLISYLAWDAIFLCFSVNSTKKFQAAQTKWLEEIRMYGRDAPIILLGLKKDTRIGSGLWAPLYSHWEARICATEGAMAASAMGAVKYLECSAKENDGVDRVFEEGARIVFDERAADEEAARIKMKAQSGGLGKMMCFK